MDRAGYLHLNILPESVIFSNFVVLTKPAQAVFLSSAQANAYIFFSKNIDSFYIIQ